MTDKASAGEDLLDVRRAASLLGCHPETVRRWVWSGRLRARRRGNRLLVARADLEAAAGRSRMIGVDEWAARARVGRESAGAKDSGRSAAELVIEDRAHRSGPAGSRARR